MKFDPDFVKALEVLSDKEKDKLILRLLENDLELASRLRLELVEAETAQTKRERVCEEILHKVELATSRYRDPADLLTDLSEISGDINQHVSITKDEYGEISLNCKMLRRALELNNPTLVKEPQKKAHSLLIYILSKLFKILVLVQKQHEDLHLELRDDLIAIGWLVGNNPSLMKLAIYNGFDVNWLIRLEIPANISEIHDRLKRDGYLK